MRVTEARLGKGSFGVNPLGTRKLLAGWNQVRNLPLVSQNRFLLEAVVSERRVPEFYQGLKAKNRQREFVKLFSTLPDDEEEGSLVTRHSLAGALDAKSLADFCGLISANQMIDYINSLEGRDMETFFMKVAPLENGARRLVDFVEKSERRDIKQYYRTLLDRWGVVAPDEEKTVNSTKPDFKGNPKGARRLLAAWGAIRQKPIAELEVFCSRAIFQPHREIDFFKALFGRGRADEFVKLVRQLSDFKLIGGLDPQNLIRLAELLTPEQLLDYLNTDSQTAERFFEAVAPTEKGSQKLQRFAKGIYSR